MLQTFSLYSAILSVLCYQVTLLDVVQSATLPDNGENLDIIKVLNTTEYMWLYWQTKSNSYDEKLVDFTITETMTCIRNRMKSISTTTYYYTQEYWLLGRINAEPTVPVMESEDYRGEFVKDATPPRSMIVYKDDDYGNDEFDVQARDDGESSSGSNGNSNGDSTGDQAGAAGATEDGNDDNVDNTFPQDKRATLMYTDENGGGCSVFFIFPVNNRITDDMGLCEMYVTGSHIKTGPSNGCMTFFKNRCNQTTIYQPYSKDCEKQLGDEASPTSDFASAQN